MTTTIDRLRDVTSFCRQGAPLPPDLAGWLAAGIERFLGRDPTGRFLLGRTAAGLVLWDADDRRPTVLAAPGDAPDTFAFADGGTHLLYLRGPADAQRLVSRRLADGHQAVFDLDARGLWLLEPAASGSLVALHFVEADPGAGGPVPAAPGGWSDGGASACRGSPMARSWISRKGTRNVVRNGRLDGGAPVPAPGFAGFAGQRFLAIEGDGRRTRPRPARGRRRPSPPGCGRARPAAHRVRGRVTGSSPRCGRRRWRRRASDRRRR